MLNDQKWPEMSKMTLILIKMPINDRNDFNEQSDINDQKWPKMTKSNQKWPKATKNDHRQLKNDSK